MSDELIVKQEDFAELCDHIRQSGLVAFDTEFVSEYTFRPQLCLLQFATADRQVAVDPFKLEDLTPWWDLMTDEETTIVVHGGREEVRFCVNLAGKRPQKLIDVQIAQGLIGLSFPLGHTALLNRVLGVEVYGKETRTDWRRRPLSDKQVHYAIEDVRHLLDVWRTQQATLEKRGRSSWAVDEFERMIDEIDAERTRENWRRLSGVNSLRSRDLAVARELYEWRSNEAEKRDRPARKILRDDLLIDVAKRQPQTVNDLLATRDMNRGPFYRDMAPAILEAIARGRDLPKAQWPKQIRKEKERDEQILGKLLSIALANRCAEQDVSMQLVGTTSDLKQLVRWHVYDKENGTVPRIAQGWRAEVCGDLLTDLLDGKITMRVGDLQSNHPIVFDEPD
ncbi:Ribonuclease D [Symmachiella dynata]|uniref:Ribonuclease D n=1 Tax=Symmachiella dynata TaxID=2527995 RepID=A0A517ZHE8_9PLAN|nr:HRDC domain-containing protein [Symmachiella dynata]QDU41891.1 Ribonuclease D [Symmachiella dynata]